MFIPKAYNSFTNPALVGLGETAVFSSTAAGVLPISYAWDFGDGMGTSTDPNPSYQFDGYGTYTVTLTTTGANGESATTTQTITVDEPPTAVIDPFDAVLANEPITLSHSSTGTPPLTVTWNLGDGTISTAESPVHSYAAVGEYTIILTATNELGEDSTTAVLQVVELPTAVIDPAGPAVVQQPITLSHSSTGTAPLAVAWAWGDGATSTDEMPSHSYAATGQYTVTLTVSNSWGVDTAEWLLVVGDASAVGTPGEGGEVIGEGITLTLPPGGTAQELTLLYTVTDQQADWADYVSAGLSFNWAAFVDGVHLTPYSFAAPVAVALDVEAAGLDPASLLLLYWDGSAWVDAAETCEAEPTRALTAQLATEICATGDFALVGRVRSGTTQYLPLIVR
jgi:PKD repeat protein